MNLHNTLCSVSNLSLRISEVTAITAVIVETSLDIRRYDILENEQSFAGMCFHSL